MTTSDSPIEASIAAPSDHCLLLVSAPTDPEAYDCFRGLAERWSKHLRREHLVIDGSVPLEPRFTSRATPAAIERILAADCSMIDEITIDVGGLDVTFRRSGGHVPYRESYYDEVRLQAHADLELRTEELAEIVREIWRRLGVVAASGTPLFSNLWGPLVAEGGMPSAAVHSTPAS